MSLSLVTNRTPPSSEYIIKNHRSKRESPKTYIVEWEKTGRPKNDSLNDYQNTQKFYTLLNEKETTKVIKTEI